MTELSSHRGAQRAVQLNRTGWGAVLLGSVIFGLLWILYIPWRDLYMPPDGDTLPDLVDGLLLVPGAHWQDWFTRGYSHFWNLYPDWQLDGKDASETAFTRPAFQFVIYLAHFVLGRDWASYQLINNFAVAGMGAIAFYIAQTVLGLRIGPSVVAAILVLLSPPVLHSWWHGVGFAIEPLATIFVAGAFLAALTRRDFLCLGLLFVALLTKENAVWAPLAAAVTILLRPKQDESLRRRIVTAAAMFLPVAMWLGLRFAFFDGIGGTYATAGYTPLAKFLKLTFFKLTHLHYLLIVYYGGMSQDRGTAFLVLDRTMAILIYALLSLLAFRTLSEAVNRLRIQKTRWQPLDPIFLVTLWAVIAVAFHLALPLNEERFATSVALFAWPALVAEVERRGKAIIWLGLAACCVVSLSRSSYLYADRIANPVRDGNYKLMDAVLHQVPAGIRQIYVLSAGSLPRANPEYVRLGLGVPAEIVRLGEIFWDCPKKNDLVHFDHEAVDGVVSMTVSLPSCAFFYFSIEQNYEKRHTKIVNGGLHRNDAISYELPEVHRDKNSWGTWWNLGQRMTVRVRTNGPARFVIEHGGPTGIAWFDVP